MQRSTKRKEMEPYADFILFLTGSQCRGEKVKIPKKWITNYGENVHTHVKIELPNGEQYNGRFQKNNRSIYEVGDLLMHFGNEEGIYMIFGYSGEGKFNLGILSEDGTEIQYPSRDGYNRDLTNPVGERFMVEVTPSTLSTGEIVLPTLFARRFKKAIPSRIHYTLKNGEQIEGKYVKKERKFVGLHSVFAQGLAGYDEGLVFTYCGYAMFEVAVFDDSNVEKMHPIYDEQRRLVEENHEIMNNDESVLQQTFSAVMTRSNVDSTSHGVYIPNSIRPREKDWNRVGSVILSIDERAWNIGLVFTYGRPRFCGGWNRFIREANIKFGDTLVFTMIEEEETVVFNVTIQEIE